MFKVYRGDPEKIQPLELGAPKSEGTAQVPHMPKFRGFRARDLISKEEAESRAVHLATEAKHKAIHEAEAKLKAPLSEAVENLENILDELAFFRRELFRESEEEVLELIRKIGKKIFNEEVSMKPELLQQLVSKSLEKLEQEKHLKLYIHPEDLQTFKSTKPNFLGKFEGHDQLQIEATPQLPRGRVLIETETQELEVGVEAMVDAIIDQIKESRVPAEEPGDDGDKV